MRQTNAKLTSKQGPSEHESVDSLYFLFVKNSDCHGHGSSQSNVMHEYLIPVSFTMQNPF